MRHGLFLIVGAALIVGLIAWSSYSQKGKVTKASWEYMVIRDPSDDGTKLNELGAQGWELVAVSDSVFNQGNNTSTRFVLKRSK
jgi:hypothetical protein